MKRFVNEHSWLLLSLRIGKVFSCRDQRTLRTLDSMYYYTQLSYLWKNETYHQAEVLIWRRTGLKCDRKETDEKRSGGGGEDLVCSAQDKRNREQGLLGNRWHCASDKKTNRLAFKWYFYC